MHFLHQSEEFISSAKTNCVGIVNLHASQKISKKKKNLLTLTFIRVTKNNVLLVSEELGKNSISLFPAKLMQNLYSDTESRMEFYCSKIINVLDFCSNIV